MSREIISMGMSPLNETLEVYLRYRLSLYGLHLWSSWPISCFLSPHYLSDLLKQETVKISLELIHLALIGEGKNLLRSADRGVAEIAYMLGFENASYFTRLFDKETGMKLLGFRTA